VRPPTAGAFAARPPALPAERRRSELSTQRRAVITALDGGEAATAAFLLFNAAYVGQIIVKPRQQADGDPYALLQGLEAYRASDGAKVAVTSRWTADEKAIVVLMRSFG